MKWVGQHIYDYVATFRQGVTMDSTLTFDSVALTGIQTSAESFVDDDVSIMTSAAIDDRINTAVTAEDLDVSADSGTAAVDLNSQSLAVRGGTNATSAATGQSVTINVDDAFLVNDGSDTTTGTITAAGFTTTGTLTMNETTSGTVGIARVQDSGTEFADNDTSIMTAAAIADKIEAYSYSTTTGDITGVTLTTDDTNTIEDNAGSADFTVAGGEGIDTTSTGSTVTITGEEASTSNKGVASFNSNHFVASSGAISLATAMTWADTTITTDTLTFTSANADDPIITIKNTSNAQNDMASLKFVKDRGAAPGVGDNLAEIYFIGEDADQNSQEYGRILCETDVVTGGQESGVLKFGVANHDGGNGYGLTLTGGSANNEIDINIGLGTASVTTVAGDLTVTGSDLTFDSVALTAVQTSSESFADNDTSLMTSAAINDRINKRTTRVYGDTIKLIPSDFVINDDVANKTIQFDNTGTTGLKPGAAGSELWAFMDIPEGKKATHLDIYASVDRTIGVYDIDINASGIGTAKGVGTSNTQLDFTDVNATATNYLGIYILTTATTDRVYGGLLTIADQ